MTNQNKIIKLIGTDQDMYSDVLFEYFFNWCAVKCVFNIPLKLLVNNESLYKWYYKQWQTYVEDAFINDFKNDIAAVDNNTVVFKELFKTYPPEINNFYPHVILKMIKETLTKTVKQ